MRSVRRRSAVPVSWLLPSFRRRVPVTRSGGWPARLVPATGSLSFNKPKTWMASASVYHFWTTESSSCPPARAPESRRRRDEKTTGGASRRPLRPRGAASHRRESPSRLGPHEGHRRRLRPQVFGEPRVHLLGRRLLHHLHLLEQVRAPEMVKENAVGDELQGIEHLNELAHPLPLRPPDFPLGDAVPAQPFQPRREPVVELVRVPGFARHHRVAEVGPGLVAGAE